MGNNKTEILSKSSVAVFPNYKSRLLGLAIVSRRSIMVPKLAELSLGIDLTGQLKSKPGT